MPVTVKRITLWRAEVDNEHGVLARTLGPLASAGVDLQAVMGYRFPGNERRAAIEVYPITGRRAAAAAQAGGLVASDIPTLLVEGDNRPGLGYKIATALGEAGINMGFLVAQVIGRKYSAVIGFDTDQDARMAVPLVRKAVTARRK